MSFFSDNYNALISVNINDFQITNSTKNHSQNHSFENHVSSICNKASQKLHALTRIVSYMNFSKRKALMKTFAYPSLTTAR